MEGIRAVLCDYGGTLDAPASHWLDRFVALYREAGVRRPFDEIKTAFYAADAAAYAEPRVAEMSLRELMDFHVGTQLDGLGIDGTGMAGLLVERFVARAEAALAESRRVLALLAPHFRLGVVSNFYGNVAHILADAQIAPLLTVIVDSNVLGISKPDPRIFAHAVAELHTEPAATMHVGDSYERDVLAAKRAGLRTAWLAAEGASPPGGGKSAADVKLRSLTALPAHLRY